MPLYQYKAVTAEGKQYHGMIEAPSRSLAAEDLQDRGEIPVNLKVKSSGLWERLHEPLQLGERIKAKEILRLTQELARLMKAGILIEQALAIVFDSQQSKAVGTLIARLQKDVRDGKSLSEALLNEKKHFPLYYVQIIHAGEISGTLDDAFERLAVLLERRFTFKSSLISALIYPSILLMLVAVTLFIVVGIVLPEFETIFAGSGEELPLPTKIVMGFGHFFSQFGIYFLLASLVGVFAFYQGLKKPAFRMKFDSHLIRIKWVGSLVVKGQFALVFRNLGSMIQNGVPIPEACQLVAETTQNLKIRHDLSDAFRKMKEGESLSRLFSEIPYVPDTAHQLLRVGEETGRLGPMMEETATILESDVETTLKRGMALFSPLMTLVMGALIAAIIGAVLMGIMSINELAF